MVSSRQCCHALLLLTPQDTNMAQLALLLLLRGDRNGLFVVGDPDQATCGFRSADPKIMLKTLDLLCKNVATFELKGNYR